MSAKNKFLSTACLLSLVCFALPSAAKADSVKLVGAGPTQSNGVYVVPYQLQVSDINGGATINVICDDYGDEVSINETWTGQIESYSNLSGAKFYDGGLGVENYDKAAYIYYQYLINQTPFNAIADNFAIWSLFNSGVPTPTDGSEATAEANILAQANTWYTGGGASSFDFSQFEVITAVGTGSTGTDPQEYIYDPTPTPEPGSLALFGSGLLGLATLLRRKLVSNS
jgi:hypothetical protein